MTDQTSSTPATEPTDQDRRNVVNIDNNVASLRRQLTAAESNGDTKNADRLRRLIDSLLDRRNEQTGTLRNTVTR